MGWRRALKRFAGYGTVLMLALAALWGVSIRMPGASHSGELPPLTESESLSSARMRSTVSWLADTIGERSMGRRNTLERTSRFIVDSLRALGYVVAEHRYPVALGAVGREATNVEATLTGRSRPDEIVLVGAHYDTAVDTPGADDNASGVAGLLELARLFAARPSPRSIRFVAFANEEPPYFMTEDMGSLRYARHARARGDSIVAMVSLESIGYYSDSARSQRYPVLLSWFYPDRADFIAFVGNVRSRRLVRDVIADFRSHTAFPSQGAAAPQQIPGIGWSDHWSFWQVGYPALMVTATAPNRNVRYHTSLDRTATLDYDRMARVIHGVGRVLESLAHPREK